MSDYPISLPDISEDNAPGDPGATDIINRVIRNVNSMGSALGLPSDPDPDSAFGRIDAQRAINDALYVARTPGAVNAATRQGWPIASGTAGTETTFQCDPRLRADVADPYLVWYNARPTNTVNPLGGEGGAVQAATLKVSLLVPVRVLKVVSVATENVVTVTNPDGTAPNLSTTAYALTGTAPFNGPGEQVYFIGFPVSSTLVHSFKQVVSTTAATVTIASAFNSGQGTTITGQECVLYRVQYVTFGGSLTGNLPVNGSLTSDPIPGLYGPNMVPTVGTINRYGPLVRTDIVTPGQFGMFEAIGSFEGSGGGDRTDVSAITTQAYGSIVAGGNPGFGPSLFVGRPTAVGLRRYGLLGDSITYGQESWYSDGRRSVLHRRCERDGFVTNLAVPGETAQLARNGCALRMAAFDAAGVDCLILAYGRNDFTNGRTAAQVAADVAAIVAQAPAGVPVHLATVTTTVGGGNEAARRAYNAMVRAGSIAGVAGYVEVADLFETARDTDAVKPGVYVDNTHPGQAGITSMSPMVTGAVYSA